MPRGIDLDRILPPLSAAQREAFTQHYRAWQVKHRITVLTAAAITACILGLLWLEQTDSDFFFVISVGILALVLMVLACIMELQKRRAIRILKSMPEFNPFFFSDEAQAAIVQMREQYDAYQKVRRHYSAMQLLVMILGFLLTAIFPFSLLIAICIACCLQYRCKQNKPYAADLFSLFSNQIERKDKAVGCCGALLIVLCFMLMLLNAMLGTVANAKRCALDSNARGVYNAALSWQEHCEEEQINGDFHTVIGCFGDETAPDTLEWGIQQFYTNTNPTDWYAVVYDEKGRLQYALFSRSKITDLTPMSIEQQRKLLSSFWHADEAMGCYQPDTTEKGENSHAAN